MIKLIASDLDGTLLQNEAQELTPRAIELIRALTQKGVHFVAASGRQYANERLLFHEIKDDISYIAENGSLCIHQGKVISQGLIEDDLAYRILRELKKEPGFEIVVSREDTCLIENNNSQFANHIVNVMHNTTEIVDDLLTVKGVFKDCVREHDFPQNNGLSERTSGEIFIRNQSCHFRKHLDRLHRSRVQQRKRAPKSDGSFRHNPRRMCRLRRSI